MASVDSGVETSNDSNDSSATEPQTVDSPAWITKEIIRPRIFRQVDRFIDPLANMIPTEPRTEDSPGWTTAVLPAPRIFPPGQRFVDPFSKRDTPRLTREETPAPLVRYPILPQFCALPVTFQSEYLFTSDVLDCDRIDVMRRNAGKRTYKLRSRLMDARKSKLACNTVEERRLRVAVMTNNIEQVQNFLSNSVNPNCPDSHMRTPLHLAACRGYADIVRLLLDNGADPNRRDLLGNTPLHLAACTSNVVVVTLLLKAGTDVKSVDFCGRSPLQIAESKLKLLQRLSSDDTSTQINNQVFQIIDMLREFLNRTGQDVEAELINAFSTRLTMSKTRDQVENQVQELLASLPHLSIDEQKCAPNNDSAAGSNNNTLNINMIDDKQKCAGLIRNTTNFPYKLSRPVTHCQFKGCLLGSYSSNLCECNSRVCSNYSLAPASVSTSSATPSGSFESSME